MALARPPANTSGGMGPALPGSGASPITAPMPSPTAGPVLTATPLNDLANPSGIPNATGPEGDPEYVAAVNAAAEKERRAHDERLRQRDLINASLQPALDQLADQAKQARLTNLSNMEGRGMLRSGETNTRLTGVEQTRLAGEGTARTGIANRLSDLDAGTQAQLAQIAQDRSMAYAQAQSRASARQEARDAAVRAWQQQQEFQRQQQEFAAQQAELARQEQQRQFDAQQALLAAAGGGGGGGGGGGRRGGGGGGAAAGGGGGAGGPSDVGSVLAQGAQQGLDAAGMAALEALLRGGRPTETIHQTRGTLTAR